MYLLVESYFNNIDKRLLLIEILSMEVFTKIIRLI